MYDDKFLAFVGGERRLPGVPQRDMSITDAARYGGVERLVSSGLYKLAKKNHKVKMLRGGIENKSLEGE